MNNLARTIFMAILGPLYFNIVEDVDHKRPSCEDDNLTEFENKKAIFLQIIFFTAFWMCIVIRIRDNHWDSYGIGALSIYLAFWSLYNHLMKSSLIKRLRKNISIDIILHFWNTIWLPIICYTMLVFLMTRRNDMYVERILPIGLNWLYVAIIFSICVPFSIYFFHLIKNHLSRSKYICNLMSRFKEGKRNFDVILVKIFCGLAIAAAIIAMLTFIGAYIILPINQQLS